MSPDENPPPVGRRRTRRRVILIVLALFFLVLVMREVLFPFQDQPYLEVPHGDHTHYVPKDRDPDVPMGQFPTRRPGPEERITPDGQIVPHQTE